MDKERFLEIRIDLGLTQTKLGIFDDMLAFGPMLDNELAFLMGAVLSVDARPTAGAYERYEDLKPVLAEQLTRLEQVQEIDLAALNALVEEKGLAAGGAETIGGSLWTGEGLLREWARSSPLRGPLPSSPGSFRECHGL